MYPCYDQSYFSLLPEEESSLRCGDHLRFHQGSVQYTSTLIVQYISSYRAVQIREFQCSADQ